MLVISRIVKVKAHGEDLSEGMIQFRISFILDSITGGPDSDLYLLAGIARAFAETEFYHVGQSYPQIYQEVIEKGQKLASQTPYMLIMNGNPKDSEPKLNPFCRPVSRKNEQSIVVARSLFMTRVSVEEEELGSGIIVGEEY